MMSSSTSSRADPSDSLHRLAQADAPVGGVACEVDTIPDRAWEEALAEFQDAHYEQTACCISGQRGEHVSHMLLRQDGVAVAGARLALYTLPGLSTGLALVRFGPFWRHRDRPAEFATYRAVLAALTEEYCERRGYCLTIRPRPHPEYYYRECEVLNELGFVVRRQMPAPDRYLVDVSLDEAAQMKSFDKKWRYSLRQALVHNFDIRMGESAADIAAFQSLYRTMVARKHIDHAGVELVDATAGLVALPPPINLRIVLAYHDGRPVTGATVGIVGDCAYYVLGASDAAALDSNAGYAVQWWILRWLATQDVRWYELGGTGDPGVRQFKKGLIGKAGVVLSMNGEYDRWTHFSGRAASDLIYGVRDIYDAIRRWRHRGR